MDKDPQVRGMRGRRGMRGLQAGDVGESLGTSGGQG